MIKRDYLNWKIPRPINKEQGFDLGLWIVDTACKGLVLACLVMLMRSCDPVLTQEYSLKQAEKAYFDALGKEVALAYNGKIRPSVNNNG